MHMQERLDKFTDIEHINKLEKEFMPKIKKFAEKSDDLIEIVDQCRQTIRSFDEDICLKASRGDLLELKMKI